MSIFEDTEPRATEDHEGVFTPYVGSPSRREGRDSKATKRGTLWTRIRHVSVT